MSEEALAGIVLRDPEALSRVYALRSEEFAESVDDPFEAARAEAAYAGFEEGRRQAAELAARERAAERERAAQALGEALATLEETISTARSQYAAAVAGLEPRIVGFAVDLVEEILGREIRLATYPGHDAVVRALDLVPREGAVTVRLNPEEAATLLEHVRTERELIVYGDPSIPRGGCVLEISSTLVDARLDHAIERVRAVLEAAAAEPLLGAETNGARLVDTPAPSLGETALVPTSQPPENRRRDDNASRAEREDSASKAAKRKARTANTTAVLVTPVQDDELADEEDDPLEVDS